MNEFEKFLRKKKIKYQLDEEENMEVNEKDLFPYELEIKKQFPLFMLKKEHLRYNVIPGRAFTENDDF